ncbi:hypothetical protein GGI07_001154 [Coemansia sp. Benny D115]|nr:hypothetical protein GGI07_001154 [Coemansia sp. Benny D115]
MCLDRLPTSIILKIIEQLRSWEYRQDDLLQLAHVSRALRRHALPVVFEYFTLTDVVARGCVDAFQAVQPHLSRILVADDTGISDEQWLRVVDKLETMDWGHVRMVSLELESLSERLEGRVGQRVAEFVATRLGGVQELWLGLGASRHVVDVARHMFECRGATFGNVRELRIIGLASSDDRSLDSVVYSVLDGSSGGGVALGTFGQLAVVHVDATAAQLTDVAQVVVRSQGSLRELHVIGCTQWLTEQLGLAPAESVGERLPVTVYTQLQRLSLSCADLHVSVDARAVPCVEALVFVQGLYPVHGGRNFVAEHSGRRLFAHGVWAQLHSLTVDALSLGDVNALALAVQTGACVLPQLHVLSLGALESDVVCEPMDTEDTRPVAVLALTRLDTVLQACPMLEHLCVSAPGEGAGGSEPRMRTSLPSHPAVHSVLSSTHTGLVHVGLDAWALTFDQLLGIVAMLPRLQSLEAVLKLSARAPPMSAKPQWAADGLSARHLAYVSIVLETAWPPRRLLRHVFKAELLRFASLLVRQGGAPLHCLEVHGLPGPAQQDEAMLVRALAALAPGCRAVLYCDESSVVAQESTR